MYLIKCFIAAALTFLTVLIYLLLLSNFPVYIIIITLVLVLTVLFAASGAFQD